MSDIKETKQEETTDPRGPKIKMKHDKDKPWDNDPTLNKWIIEEFKPEYNPSGMVDESSFSVLFPQYREKYIKEIWPLLKNELKKFKITAELNLIEGSLLVKTTR
jgi:ribosomal RNA assembly protein